MVRMRPGVVQRNHHRGCAGLVCDRDARGSVEGCANSTVTCARTSAFRLLSRLLDCKGILRAGGGTRGTIADTQRQISEAGCTADIAAAPYPEPVRGDGDGWVLSDDGAHFWGRHGAAGLLLRAPRPDGSAAVLLQHRAPWSHQGGTWSLPGGATGQPRDRRGGGRPRGARGGGPQRRSAGGAGNRGDGHRRRRLDWTYTTVIADAPEPLATVPNRESSELRWVAEDEVAEPAAAPRVRGQLGPAADGGGGLSVRGQSRAVTAALSSRAAAVGSSAAVIARTTTMRRAPASSTSASRSASMPPMANHGIWLPRGRGRADQVEAGRRAARLRRGRPARARRRSSRSRPVPPRTPRPRPARRRGWTGRSPGRARRCRGPPAAADRPDRGAARRAPAARATSARSLTANSAPCRRAASASTSSASSSWRASSGPNRASPAEPLSRSWMTSTPPASAASAKSARSPRSRLASVHRYSRAVGECCLREFGIEWSWCGHAANTSDRASILEHATRESRDRGLRVGASHPYRHT